MDKQKAFKGMVIGLACVVLLGLTGFIFYQNQQIKKLSQSAESATPLKDKTTREANLIPNATPIKTSAQNASVSKKQGYHSENDIEELNYQLNASEEELDMAQKRLSDEQKKKAEIKKAQIELQKKYMKDPSMKKSMRDMMSVQYSDLFKELNLSPEKLEKFKDLLADEMVAQQEAYMDVGGFGEPLSKEKQDELNKRSEALNKEYEDKKNELLGNSDFGKYKTYSERMSERYYVTSFMDSLDTTEKLTEGQKSNLIEAMHSESKSLRDEYKKNDKAEQPADMYDEKGIARMMEMQDRRSEAYLKATKGILSASQTEQFKNYLKRQRDLFESSMKMLALTNVSQNSQKDNDKQSK
jgi:hypothetical protein